MIMTDNEKNQQEMIFQLQMFEQQIDQLQQQIQAVEQAVIDMKTLNYDLDELVGKKDKEILAAIGRGIFANPNPDKSLELKYSKIYGLTHLSIYILKKFKKKVYEKEVVYLINLFQILIMSIGYLLLL